MMLKATGKKGVPQGGVISPLLSNLYLNEVDKMLERAKEVTRNGKYTYIEYARYADDLVILVDAFPRHDWLLQAVTKRLREELAKTPRRDQRGEKPGRGPGQGGELRIPGLRVPPRPQCERGVAAALHAQAEEANGAAGTLKDIFRRFQSQPIGRVVHSSTRSCAAG